MTRRTWVIVGVVLAVVVVVIVVAVALSSSRRVLTSRTSRGAGSTPPADAVFTVDSAGRYPSDPGYVDEGATVDV